MTDAPRQPRPSHPYADIFPMMSAEEHAELVADIKAHGLRDPIAVNGDDLVIDGRNREKACCELGIEPTSETLAIPDRDLLSWIVSKNLHRRHLTTAQRAAVAAELANLSHGQNKSRMLKPAQAGRSQDPSHTAALPVTVDEAAKILGVSSASVKRAKRALKTDADLHAQMKAGKITVGEAVRQVKEQEQEEDPADCRDAAARVVGSASKKKSSGGGRGSPEAKEKQMATRRSNKAIRDLVRWQSTHETFAQTDAAVGAALPLVVKAIKAARTARPDAGAIKVV